jgi:hypothetical protein
MSESPPRQDANGHLFVERGGCFQPSCAYCNAFEGVGRGNHPCERPTLMSESPLRQQIAEAIHTVCADSSDGVSLAVCEFRYEHGQVADAVLALLNLTEEAWTTKVRILLGEEADAYDAGYAAGISRRLPSHHTDSSEPA